MTCLKVLTLIIYDYWYFLDNGFKFQPVVRHDVLMMFINLNDIAILNIRGVDYRCIINGVSKSEPTNLLQNTDLSKKVQHYKI